MSKASVYRRMRRTDCRAAVESERTTGVIDAVRTVRGLAERGLFLLAEVIDDDERPDAVRVRAASTVLGHHERLLALPLVTEQTTKGLTDALAELETLVLGTHDGANNPHAIGDAH